MHMRRGSLFGLLLLMVLLVAGGRALWLWLDRPITRVVIEGQLQHVSPAYLRDRLAPLVAGETWLSVDLGELRERAREIGWLAEVRLGRQWPDGLVFSLDEQRPVARWHDDFLLDEGGEPFDFDGEGLPEGLPDLAGPPGSGPEVLAYYRRLQAQLAELGVEVTQLRLEERGAWRLQLDHGLWVMLGRNDRPARLARFAAAWERELAPLADYIRYVDLRYPNGIAVAWHGESDTEGLEVPANS